jgi:hypothetical protein
VILDPRSGQAASNSSPRRRAGSEISFSSRGPPKKGKPAHKSGLSPIFFAQLRTTQKNFAPAGAKSKIKKGGFRRLF